ncbi:bifunctional DNA primase/polymerase [Streptomyces pactum]|uniref:Bifunctional DNA primase/polymerase n=1 Tax=Streptomyces pactum TaxID=68249 RepID=A0ABS0NQ92_9ACTN|nr:bifunctional DNA primase/polymerase [Streptomyces pactum]MBH5337262.1 bifunctional DNA primase/polymerase [Streptomyces pactum]
MGDTGAKRAVEWLVSAAPDPGACRWAWERHPLGVALLPAGRVWDVLVVPGRLGRRTLRVLGRRAEPAGPVLGDARGDGDARVGFLVPAGTAAHWVGTGIRGLGPGSWVVVPHPGRTAGRVRWLAAPDGSGRLTTPGLLELALHQAVVELADEDRYRRGRAHR